MTVMKKSRFKMTEWLMAGLNLFLLFSFVNIKIWESNFLKLINKIF